MKATAFILATFISFLIVQPTMLQFYSSFSQLTQDNSCTDACCKHEQTDNKQKPDNQNSNDCCPKGGCNPLEQCTCCVCLTVSQTPIQFITTVVLNKHITPISVGIVSKYSADCFHPPEIV